MENNLFILTAFGRIGILDVEINKIRSKLDGFFAELKKLCFNLGIGQKSKLESMLLEKQKKR